MTATPSPKFTRRNTRIEDEKFAMELKTKTDGLVGKYSLYVLRLGEGTGYGFFENERIPGASVFKVPVLVMGEKLLAEGKIHLDDTYILDEQDRRTGAGPLEFIPAGTRMTIDDLFNYLAKNSDNTAWAALNRMFGRDKSGFDYGIGDEAEHISGRDDDGL